LPGVEIVGIQFDRLAIGGVSVAVTILRLAQLPQQVMDLRLFGIALDEVLHDALRDRARMLAVEYAFAAEAEIGNAAELVGHHLEGALIMPLRFRDIALG